MWTQELPPGETREPELERQRREEVPTGRRESTHETRRTVMWDSLKRVAVNTGTVPELVGGSWMQEMENLVKQIAQSGSGQPLWSLAL